jgi:hypothetical protein
MSLRRDGPGALAGATETGGNRAYAGRRLDNALARLVQLPNAIADRQFRHAVERLHRLRPRPLYELLLQLGADQLIRAEIKRRVERYAALDPEILRATGGDQFPAVPLLLVPERWPRT